MAIFNNLQLSVDVKAQDILRQWFSKRGGASNVVITCVGLGDSDVDYNMSQQVSRIKVVQAPYNTPRIKHHLYYSGVETNITGVITTFLRRVNEFDRVESLYNYPGSMTYTEGVIPPTLANGYDYVTINFDTGSIVKEGFIAYFQTLPDNYVDGSGVQQRMKEEYSFTFIDVPNTWEVIVDQTNGSFLIAKPAAYTFLSYQGSIRVKGLASGLERTILFNY